MAVGMSTVFAFLGILVISMLALAKVAAFFPPAETPVPQSQTPAPDSEAEVAVILAAIEAYRRANGVTEGSG